MIPGTPNTYPSPTSMYLFRPSLSSLTFAVDLYKDVKSSNGTFINSERLSSEGHESEPFELKSDDIVVSLHPFIILFWS
jgi:pSer/pThr/pTyr-binding forkhead associated (FHA) protein